MSNETPIELEPLGWYAPPEVLPLILDYARRMVRKDRTLNATAQGMVPTGWKITIEGDTAQIVSPVEGPGITVVAEQSRRLDDRMLFALAKALAAAPTAPLPAVDAVAGEPVALTDDEVLALFGKAVGHEPASNWRTLKTWGQFFKYTEIIKAARVLLSSPPRAGSETTASASVQEVMGAEVVAHLEIAVQGVEALIDSLMPCFENVGVSLRISAEDHAAIRSAMAGASTAVKLIRNAIGATHAAPSQGATDPHLQTR